MGKVARGYKASGLAGAKLGAKSGALNYAEKALGMVPGSKNKAFKLGNKDFYSNLLRGTAKKAKTAKGELEDVVGKTLQEDIAKISTRRKWGDITRDAMMKTDAGRYLVEHGEYSPGNFFHNARITEAVEKAALKKKRAGEDIIANIMADDAPNMIEASVSKGQKFTSKMESSIKEGQDIAMGKRATGLVDDALKKQTDINQDTLKAEMLKIKENFLSDPKSAKTLEKLGKLTPEEELEYYKMFTHFSTGIKPWDEAMAKILVSPHMSKLLKADAVFQGMFKMAKVPWNMLTSGTNSVFGNLVMAGMMGVNVFDTGFKKGIGQALAIVGGKSNKETQALFKSPLWNKVLKNDSDVFEMVFGVNPKVLEAGEDFIRRYATVDYKSGDLFMKGTDSTSQIWNATVGKALNSKKNKEILRKEGITNKNILEKLSSRSGIKPADLEEVTGRADVISASREAMRMATSARGAAERGVETSLLSHEILQGPFMDFLDKVKKKGDKGSVFAKFYHKAATGPLDLYNKFDQVYKLGTALKLANHGINEQELFKIAKRIDLSGTGDFVESKTRNIYKLSPIKAMEVANEAFMNYAAMPDFVKLMRIAPFMGNNFISFGYGMSSLAGKTAANNPAYLNKVQFFMQELGGEKTPLEKKALQGKYYSWLDRPGMVKMPFFTKNPTYLNAENMIPYYTMNLLTPTERSYEDKFGNAAAKVIDNTPFFKKPEGQLFLDYFLFPMLLGEERAKGSFGQYLFPKDATIQDKVASFSKSAASTVLPGSAGPLGFALPEGAAKYSPLYSVTKAINAKYGKTPAGKPSKEPASSRILSTLGGTFGMPNKQINLDFVKVDDDNKK